MNIVFADTFYYLALLNADDEAHGRAVEMTERYAGRMVTTAWVLTELADGLCRSTTRAFLFQFLETLLADPEVTFVPPSDELFRQGLDLYGRRPDKDWSLTDCISFTVMGRQRITQALTADHHFEQAGFVAILK
jgi:uncharacterized protein